MDKLTDLDKKIIATNMHGRKFSIENSLCVAHRCKWGYPQVIMTSPIFKNGEPCPTLFWLVCPYLEKVCGKLESNAGVTELEAIFKQRPKEIATLHEEYKNLRIEVAKKYIKTWNVIDDKLKESLTQKGIGGINTNVCPTAAKCLHLQLATLLGLGHHPAENWFKEKLENFSCACESCSDVAKDSYQI